MNPYKERTWTEKVYGPTKHKTFESAVISFLEREFPHLTGPLTRETFVNTLKSMVETFYPPTKNLKAGQFLWIAVAKEEKASYGKKMSSTRSVPVILTLIDQRDIERRMNGEEPSACEKEVIARLLKEAYSQGAVLSEADLSIILRKGVGPISKLILQYEKEHDTSLPGRGNIHDLGRSLSHKKEIVKKVKLDGKSPSDVARETNHSLRAVDRYTLDFERINFCLKKGLTVNETSFATSLNNNLVFEYVGIIDNLKTTEKKSDEKELQDLLNNPPF
jgi:hypothetical protein